MQQPFPCLSHSSTNMCLSSSLDRTQPTPPPSSYALSNHRSPRSATNPHPSAPSPSTSLGHPPRPPMPATQSDCATSATFTLSHFASSASPACTRRRTTRTSTAKQQGRAPASVAPCLDPSRPRRVPSRDGFIATASRLEHAGWNMHETLKDEKKQKGVKQQGRRALCNAKQNSKPTHAFVKVVVNRPAGYTNLLSVSRA
ncbi:hypothetical protein PSPO01_12381 [Paraphaeosphaeria sporulosa]